MYAAARMELDAVDLETIKLSVPTRFLKSWIQSHYAEKLLGCWQSEQPTTTRIELTVRCEGRLWRKQGV